MIETKTVKNEIEVIKNSFEISFREIWRKEFLLRNLKTLKTPEQILIFFFRYIGFNSVFAGGVSRLAGAAHILQKSFMGLERNFNRNIYSKSSEIASNIFAAAEDEFNAAKEINRVTHRDMARFFLDSTLEYFNEIDFRFFQVDSKLESLLNDVMIGYCIKNIPTDKNLIHGIGFHIASEELADQEFVSIKEFLCSVLGDLVNYLRNKKHSSGLSAFYWVEVHCDVEKDHHDYAIKAMELAYNNYTGDLTSLELQKEFESGYESFCLLQEKMINYCCNV